jgi:hypothetical protein
VTWLFGQLVGWQEIALALAMLIVGLFLEDAIDQWRYRRRKG